MSTRCLICKKLPDGKVRGIYCHHDGNLRWVGRTLLDCYADDRKIDALLDLGAISSLGKVSVPSSLEAKLRPYQREGYEWLARHAACGFGACLADDMGLGKTVQIISLLLNRASDGPSLVIAPASVCGNWRTELKRFAPSLSLGNQRGDLRLDRNAIG